MSGEQQSDPKLVRDLMTVGVFTCQQDTPVVDLARVMQEKEIEGAVVLDKEGHAVGVVTYNELVAAYGLGKYQEQTAEDIMMPGVPQVPPDIPLGAAAQIMQDQGIRVLFLMHNAGGIIYPAAFLSYKHFLRHMTKREDDDLKDLGIHADRKSPMDYYLERREAARRKNLPKEKS
ncbi:HPP family protein [Chloroflexota bacterium]